MAEYIEPLNLEKIFSNYFAGTPEIFAFILIMLLSYVAGKNGLTTRVYTALLILSGTIVGGVLEITWYYILAGMLLIFSVFKVAQRIAQ